jgi:hypothetical protein
VVQGSERGLVTNGPGTVKVTNVQTLLPVRLVLGDDGIKVRNGLRSWRIRWDQVRLFTDGSWRWVANTWALRIELHDGRAITSVATADIDGMHPGRPEMVAAIRQAAEWHDILAVFTGPRPHDQD